MPGECPPAFRIEAAAAGTDSAKRKSDRSPSASAPARCHAGAAFLKKRDDASVTQALAD